MSTPGGFRDGIIGKDHPYLTAVTNSSASNSNERGRNKQRTDGVELAKAAGLPEFLWNTQGPKRRRDPSAPKQKRQRYTKETKEMILAALNSTPDAKIHDIAKQFNLPEGTLRGWSDDEKRQKAAEEAVVAAAASDPLGLNEIQESIMMDPTPVDIGDGPHLVAAAASVATVPASSARTNTEVNQPPKKKRRQRYSNETKIQVILALETRKGCTLNDIAKEFHVASGTVRGWRDEADKIQKQAMENRRAGAKANPSRDPLKRIWNAIISLFEKNSQLPPSQRLNVNVAVVRTIGRQARDTLLEAHRNSPFLTLTEVTNMEKFKASETWARKWAKDHQVLTVTGKFQQGPLFDRTQSSFLNLQSIVHEYSANCVYTMTSMGLYYRILPHRTYITKVSEGSMHMRACKGLKTKDRLTLYVCTNETGSAKLPIACIGKYENPACFRVAAQKSLPYFSQKQALSDPSTFQMWWRTIFLPHIRSKHPEGENCLLLVESTGTCKAELLKDPTGQVRVEGLPTPTPAATLAKKKGADDAVGKQPKESMFAQYQALKYDILETIKRRYRYRLMQEVMEAFTEREERQKVANDAQFPVAARGLREGSLANICDAMCLLGSIWEEVAQSTVTKAWQQTKLRPKSASSKDDYDNDKLNTTNGDSGQKQRAKSEKRQTTREKKQVVRDLNVFLKKNESNNFSNQPNFCALKEAVEKLKNRFLYSDGGVIDDKDLMDALESWVGLEGSNIVRQLHFEEIKEEMNIQYLVGLRQPIENVVPEADEPEDPELESWLVEKNNLAQKPKEELPIEELDLETAVALATTIKATACKLFEHGNILGDLAVQLNDAADSVFGLLRQQKEASVAREQAERTKAQAKKNAAARKARKAAQAAEGTAAVALTEVVVHHQPQHHLESPSVAEIPGIDPLVEDGTNMVAGV